MTGARDEKGTGTGVLGKGTLTLLVVPVLSHGGGPAHATVPRLNGGWAWVYFPLIWPLERMENCFRAPVRRAF